ncbi:MAG TPA: Uma2 family endonuclease [Leptolyngbyaceae cyanobacterium M33_DOE_097]|uniref:Uma2 family endonuclease n=1 Tax=Oscillatoriales cyanobacterium SpSt-418 TaxID=2282169 RepID=A0A7C3KEP9_9CYAN|nr:Uma2 family endonuclease [Leptolyngbyaceae cyanobacterium M33_DOE_097]
MVQARLRFKNFEEYLLVNPEDLPEGRYEYVEGELVDLMPEGEESEWIANYLFLLLTQAGIVAPRLIRPGRCEIEVPGVPRTRFPDLVILDEAHLELTKRRLTITADMPPPRLVVEVVSPGKKNRKRDLEDKRRQYQSRGIPEYWLIDPEQQQVSVLHLTGDNYVESGVFQGGDRVNSPSFGLLPFTAEQVLAGQ